MNVETIYLLKEIGMNKQTNIPHLLSLITLALDWEFFASHFFDDISPLNQPFENSYFSILGQNFKVLQMIWSIEL